ncbi:hypothetical protein CEXT_34791 [Caerostris extrusa]|uniref:Uncharacterized protein n=1 Tax=Caerostris extrusa TaxID=172846 RepID=A0AAV4VWR1_CAEEX|nr:hypothetical protein CEXT_34791 [Caerostris extrusa]
MQVDKGLDALRVACQSLSGWHQLEDDSNSAITNAHLYSSATERWSIQGGDFWCVSPAYKYLESFFRPLSALAARHHQFAFRPVWPIFSEDMPKEHLWNPRLKA